MCKFPIEVVIKLEETKEPAIPWTMKTLRETLQHYISVHENAQRYVFNSNSKGQTLSHSGYSSIKNNNSSHNKGQRIVSHLEKDGELADVFSANIQLGRSSNSRSASLPCIFCKGKHYNDMCDKVVSLCDRKQSLSHQKRCFVCLKIGHLVKDCPSIDKKACCYCGRRGLHNRCICPQKFGKPETSSFIVSESSKLPIGSGPSHTQQQQRQQLDQPVGAIGTADGIDTTQMLTTSGERVVLQTAVVEVRSTDESVRATA